MDICDFMCNCTSLKSHGFTTDSTSKGHLTLCQLRAFLSFFQLLLSLAELGQVQGSNFLSLLNLLLVGSDLLLQFLGKLSHPVLVLVVLILLELQLLDAALRLLEALVCV